MRTHIYIYICGGINIYNFKHAKRPIRIAYTHKGIKAILISMLIQICIQDGDKTLKDTWYNATCYAQIIPGGCEGCDTWASDIISSKCGLMWPHIPCQPPLVPPLTPRTSHHVRDGFVVICVNAALVFLFRNRHNAFNR